MTQDAEAPAIPMTWADRAELARLRSEFMRLSAHNAALVRALEEIADDPTGVSMYQAELARAALAMKEE